MSTVRDIYRMHVAPRATLRTRLDHDPSEASALAVLMVACLLMFVGQWPRLLRESYEQNAGITFEVLFAGALMGWIFMAPLAFYLLALVAFWVLRLFARPTPFEVRYAIFWGLLAATPLALLNGLTAGLIGPGPSLTLTGVISLAALVVFWGAGLVEVSTREVAA